MGERRDERPQAEEKPSAYFLNASPSGSASGYLVPMKPLHVGPASPVPATEWHVPPLEPRDPVRASATGTSPDKPA